MKIAIVTNFLYPEGLGGTELYCYNLAKALIRSGNELYWFVPNWNQHTTVVSEFEHIKIVRFASIEQSKISEQGFVASSFINEMQSRNISVAHFNEFGGPEGISANLLNASKRSGLRTVVTLHLLNYLCRQGFMRHVNKENNHGIFKTYRCGNCLVQSTRSRLSVPIMPMLKFFAKSKLPLPANFRNKVSYENDDLPLVHALKNSADVIVSLTKWFSDVLIANDIHPSGISYIPQGEPDVQDGSVKNKSGFVFISRMHKEKGIDILLKTARILEEKKQNIHIDLFGPLPAGLQHTQDFLTEIKGMKNIHYKGVLPPEKVKEVIACYKAVLLPSIVSEMAPMIIMEANRLKTPVIATDVPGSRELITQYDCGLISRYNDAADFADKILQVESGKKHFNFIQKSNSFDVVASRYLEVYNVEKIKS